MASRKAASKALQTVVWKGIATVESKVLHWVAQMASCSAVPKAASRAVLMDSHLAAC
jgi:uncharacterized membrane-anchored protein